MNSNPTDKEIVRRVLRGDLEAFSHIVREYSPRMLNLALGIVGGSRGSGGSGERAAAEDVVQDALVKAYEKLSSWRGESSLSTWLYRITYTTAVSSLRGRKVFLSDNGEGSEGCGAANLSTEDGEADWQVTEENIARMRRALDRLAPLDRTLVNLFYLEERPVREVAAICGQSEANVKTRLHRARTQLRKLMMSG